MKTLLTTLLIISSFALFSQDSLTVSETPRERAIRVLPPIIERQQAQYKPTFDDVKINQQRIQKLEQEIEEIKQLINSLKQ